MNCATNIITANFSGGKTHATTARVYQWSRGIELCITGADNLPQTFKAHFSVQKRGGVATTVVGIDERVEVPNVLFTIGKDIHVWLGTSETEDDAEILYTVDIPVAPAPMPEYYDAEDTGVFDAVVEQVADYAATATAAANSAGASATAAAGSASAAAASASGAAGSAGAAGQAMADAVTAKGQAETAAQTATEKAQQSAQNAEQAASNAGRAESAAQSAEAAQTGAEAAQTAAQTAAQDAAASASAASTSATSAGQAATSAGQSATAAAGSATTASNAAQTATTKAGEASASATAANAAKTAAQTAQTAAETAATNAGQSASTATAKASEAAQSASGAAQSKTDAEAAATRAEQAAASLTVDTALSDSSTNPVQNKVITGELTDVKSAIDALDDRVSSLDGLYPITLELGNIGYGWSALTFSDSTTRMRTPQNGGVPVSVGDIITMGDWTGNAFYPIIYESDNHYHNFSGWVTSDFEIPSDGILYFTIRKDPERILTESDAFEIFVKKPDRISELGVRVTTLETEALTFSGDISELKRDKRESVFPVLVSHGGLEGLYPENTVLGVLGAKKYGYAVTEADLRITSDGHFVMCHDETVDRTTDGTGTISEMTLAQVKACNIDKWGAYTYNTWTWDNLKIPTLEEYLNACIWCGIIPMIEARDFTESQLDSLIAILRQYNLEDAVIVESFTKATINYLRSKSSVRLGALLDATEASVDYCKGVGNCILAINATSADPTPAFMEYARANSVPIVAWTVNAIKRIQSLALLGVSHVITDIAVYGNDLSEMYCTAYHPISDINSDSADNWGFRYYVGDMLASWNISGTPLKTIATFSAEIYYDTNKPTLRLCNESVTLADKPGEWQTVMTSKVIQMTSGLATNASLSLKLAESGNVKMKNAVVKFYNV